MQALPRKVAIAAQIAAAALLVYFVGRTVAQQWTVIRNQPLEVDVGIGSLLASGAAVFASYALLIQVWRMLIESSGSTIPYWTATRIWSVSGLWRYVPGKVWSIGAMSAMAQRANVPAVTAAGSAVLNTVLSTAVGLAIALVLGWRWIDRLNPNASGAAILLLVAAVLGLLALPYAMPRITRLVGRVTGREVGVRIPPPGALGLAVVGNILAWALYGLAFMWLVKGVLGEASGALWQYVAVYTASYVAGYVILIAPGGIGPREAIMFQLMTSLGLATAKEAMFVTVASRLWLIVLEILPGLSFLAFDRFRPHPTTTIPSDAPRK